MARRAENVGAFYNKCGTCEQWIKEDKGGDQLDPASCRSFTTNAVRLQFHTRAYKLGNFLHTLATPEPIKDWTLKEKPVLSSVALSKAPYRQRIGPKPYSIRRFRA
jgi:hypothetical protein